MTEEQRPALRVGDAEREATARQLRQHAAEGRLTLDELDERLSEAYAARTVPELNRLLEDLPAIRLDPVPVARTPAPQGPAPAGPGPSRMMWASWASVNVVVFVIWLLTSIANDDWNPWFLWVAGPWGAVLLGREITTRVHRREIEG